MRAVTKIELPGVTKLRSGKVREVFALGDELLMVATDRVSAFDVVMPNGIPDKGKILNQLSHYWFQRFESIVPHHVITADDADIASRLGTAYDASVLEGRSMLVKKCEPILIESVARAYLSGSLYKEYIAEGGATAPVTLHGINLPEGIALCGKLPNSIFTPATKAQEGHDENISFSDAARIVGTEIVESCRNLTLTIFELARKFCEQTGIILADTKFEFGILNDEIILIDEVLTPDSSRYWPAETYTPGRAQDSLDKQYLRDYLEALDWDKTEPGPALPESVVLETRERYCDIFRRLTGGDPKI
jgi:phosphoribosylaminoimidazole-succinocarboxamide synthase